MKKIKIILLLCCTYTISFAQNISIDNEKLLEYYQTQRYAEAAQYLQSVYPSDTKDIKALGQMAYCYMMAGKLADAEQKYLTINKLQPNTLPVLFNLTSINLKRGLKTNARQYLSQIITLDSNNFNAYKQLANITPDSLLRPVLVKANNLNPTDGDVAIDLARLYRNDKQYESAYKILQLAINADTLNFSLQQIQLPIANELKKFREVISIGEKLLQIDQDANVIKDVGKAYFSLKNYQKCIFYYQQLEQMDKANETIYYYLSLCFREQKNNKLAAVYANKTINEAISPYTSSYYMLLGGIYENDNKNQSAITAYKRGLTFEANPGLYYRLGLIYDLKLQQKQNAIINYNLFLKSKLSSEDKPQIDYVKDRIIALKSPTTPQK